MDLVRCWNASSNGRFGEFRDPPVQIFGELSRWGVWKVRTVVKDAKHGFQAGDVGSSIWVGQSGMGQLSVEFLSLAQGVRP